MKKIIFFILLTSLLIYQLSLNLRISKLEKLLLLESKESLEIGVRYISNKNDEIDAGDVTYNKNKFRYPRKSVGEALQKLEDRIDDIEYQLSQ